MLISADATLSDAICGLSFAATPVATPSGERLIASLHISDKVLTYVPATGKVATQTVAKVFLNHDRLDVTLALPSSQNQTAPAATTRHATTAAETAREQARRVAGHGLRAPPDATAANTAPAASATGATRVASATSPAATEVIHTTANHPWLTADHG